MLQRSQVLGNLPATIRDELLQTFGAVTQNYAEHRWEPSELNGGKLSEVVFTIVDGTLRGSIPLAASKPSRFADACRALEQVPSDPSRIGDRSLRVLMPRVLIALYEIRNHRSVGHVGGDVTPNAMDAAVVVNMSSWVMCELIRIFHGLATHDAQRVVDSLSERRVPLIWEIDGIRRVLSTTLSKAEETLLLLYSSHDWVAVSTLVREVEYSNASAFRKKLLQKLHDSRDVIFDVSADRVILTPKGANGIENELLKAT